MIRDSLAALANRAMMRDEAYFAEALREFETGVRRDGLWAMAIIKSAGADDRVKPIYLQLLASSLKDEYQKSAAALRAEQELSARQAAQDLANRVAQPTRGDTYYYLKGGKEVGPVLGADMKRLANKLPASTPTRSNVMQGWATILQMRSILDRH